MYTWKSIGHYLLSTLYWRTGHDVFAIFLMIKEACEETRSRPSKTCPAAGEGKGWIQEATESMAKDLNRGFGMQASWDCKRSEENEGLANPVCKCAESRATHKARSRKGTDVIGHPGQKSRSNCWRSKNPNTLFGASEARLFQDEDDKREERNDLKESLLSETFCKGVRSRRIRSFWVSPSE